jgi:hypothetical protein
MKNRASDRSVTSADASAVAELLRDLGCPTEHDLAATTLERLLEEPMASVAVTIVDEQGVVGFLSLSYCPPRDEFG